MSETKKARLPTTNRILKTLPRDEYERLAPHLEAVTMPLGKIICHPHEPITHVYFPNSGTVSVISVFEDGGSVEIGVVGNEGMFGVGVIMGSFTAPFQAIVQLRGEGLRMRADVIREEFRKGEHLHDLLLRYTQAFIIQIAQTAACNRAHKVEERLARWLLMCQDRDNSDQLELTHEFIAIMLGTRRAGVTQAAGQLQHAGIIKYTRGHIRILSRDKLEAASCECYAIVKKEFDRLFRADLRYAEAESKSVRVPTPLRAPALSRLI